MTKALKNSVFKCTIWAAGLVSITILLFLITTLIWKGFSAISFDFLFSESKNFGSEGGIVYQIIGSLLLTLCAAAISFPLALGVAIYKSEYIKNKNIQTFTDTIIFSLNGIPSIIFGIFGLIFFVNVLQTGVSWFVGGIILAIMILPTIILSSYQSIKSIPITYRENASALGLTKWKVVRTVIFPRAINGAFTGLLLGLARAIGETAPIMFIATAFSGVSFPQSLMEPVSSLPTHILALAQQATNPQALQNAWGSSLVLVTLVFVFSISALVRRIQYSKINY
ncbi:phosphate ABC transporter permease PstA [Lacinutrix chionoecetis]